jgi:hypothetical protein
MAQADSRRPLTAEDRVRALVIPRVICSGQSDIETGLSLRSSGFPCQYHSSMIPRADISSGDVKSLVVGRS